MTAITFYALSGFIGPLSILHEKLFQCILLYSPSRPCAICRESYIMIHLSGRLCIAYIVQEEDMLFQSLKSLVLYFNTLKDIKNDKFNLMNRTSQKRILSNSPLVGLYFQYHKLLCFQLLTSCHLLSITNARVYVRVTYILLSRQTLITYVGI